MTYRHIRKSDLRKIRKKYGLSPGDPLTASQFRELQLLAASSPKAPVFSFRYDLRFDIGDGERLERIVVTLRGNHLSKNRYDALATRYRFRYIRAIKEAASAATLRYAGELRKLKREGELPLERAVVRYTYYNTHSRDHDNGSETMKRFQDTFTALGLIVDDRRENLRMDGEPAEILVSKKEERKIVAVIERDGRL